MLDNKELKLVNEIVKTFDNTVEIVADVNTITIVEIDPKLNEVYTNKVDFIDEVIEIVKIIFDEVDRVKFTNWMIELNNMKYNHLKNIVIEATEKGTFKDVSRHIKLLDDFINMYCYDACSLKQSQNIKTYRNIIINCETVAELQETLKDIYYMKQYNNVKNNDYLLSTVEEVENDRMLFKNECNKHSELYDPEVAKHLAKYKILNRKFMYMV